MIRKLRREGHGWKQIMLTINKAGYRTENGKQFTVDDVREEYAEMTLEEEVGNQETKPNLGEMRGITPSMRN